MEQLSHTHPDDTSELLSAYTDDAVDIVERRRVEEYVQRCAACAQELRDLRMFKQLLHELPNVQPLRSFTIDPATAPRPRWLLFPTFRVASLVASLLLLIVLGVDGFTSMGAGGGVTSASADTSSSQIQRKSEGFGAAGTGAAADQGPAEAGGVPEAAQAPSIAMASGTAGVEEALPEAALSADAIAPSAEGGAAGIDAAGGDGTTDTLPSAPSMPAVVELNTAVANEPASGASDPTAARLPAEPTAVAAGGVAEESELQSAPRAGIDTETLNDEAQATANRSSISTLRMIELVLGVIAVAFGIAALVAWRRSL